MSLGREISYVNNFSYGFFTLFTTDFARLSLYPQRRVGACMYTQPTEEMDFEN